MPHRRRFGLRSRCMLAAVVAVASVGTTPADASLVGETVTVSIVAGFGHTLLEQHDVVVGEGVEFLEEGGLVAIDIGADTIRFTFPQELGPLPNWSAVVSGIGATNAAVWVQDILVVGFAGVLPNVSQRRPGDGFLADTTD